MKYLEIVKQLETFDLPTLSELTNLKGKSLYKLVNRRVKDNIFIQLKKGLYTTRFYLESNSTILYKEKIANQLKIPSYLSLEYMLSKYSILTESVYSFTSISTKKTKTYTNTLGTYLYRNLTKRLFTGYFIENDIYYATKSKALFDYLYFKSIDVDIASLRLNIDEINSKDLEELKAYCKTNSRMEKIYTNLITYKNNVS